MQQVGLHLGYISRAFGAPSSQINEDINIKNTLEFYFENGISYSYDEFYSFSKIPIDNFSFSDLNKEFNLPKETLRRKVLELEKLGVIKKEKKNFLSTDHLTI